MLEEIRSRISAAKFSIATGVEPPLSGPLERAFEAIEEMTVLIDHHLETDGKTPVSNQTIQDLEQTERNIRMGLYEHVSEKHRTQLDVLRDLIDSLPNAPF